MLLFELIYNAASATFIQVGTFVAVTLLIFGYWEFKSDGKLKFYFSKYKNLQVIFGTLLGLTPGCGGAIIVMPLYLTGQVSFGTVVATLIATMGDAAFILIVSEFNTFIIVSIISGITAIITGYLIDHFKITVLRTPYTEQGLETTNKEVFGNEITDWDYVKQEKNHQTTSAMYYNHWLYYFRHHIGYIIFWILALLAFPLGILNLMQIDFNTAFPIKNLGIIGALGTLFSIIYSFLCKKYIADDSIPETNSKINSLKETFIHNAEETAFVIMWVFVALFLYEVLVIMIGGEQAMQSFMTQSGYWAVLVGILVGLIPGCGPQIVLAMLYTQGLLPLSALVANAICNDGDALFPLLAMDKKSAFYATIYNLIPAFLVGTLMFMLGY